MDTPRLRVFAGPNGSGKSTLKSLLAKEWFGTYINADDIERTVRLEGGLRLADFNVDVTQHELTRFFLESSLLGAHGPAKDAHAITVDTGYVTATGSWSPDRIEALKALLIKRSQQGDGYEYRGG